MQVMISDDKKTAYLIKDNGRKNRYEIIQAIDSYKVYVSRKHHNSKWSEKWLLLESKQPLRIIENEEAPMKIEFEIISDINSLDIIHKVS